MLQHGTVPGAVCVLLDKRGLVSDLGKGPAAWNGHWSGTSLSFVFQSGDLQPEAT